MMKNEKKKKI